MGKWDMPAKHEIKDTELRFNPYHDPQNGRFTDGSGGSSGVLVVNKGGKGNGFYVDNKNNIKEAIKLKQLLSANETELKYARYYVHKFGTVKYGGTKATRELFYQWSDELSRLNKINDQLQTKLETISRPYTNYPLF